MSDLPDSHDIEWYTDADPSLTIAELNSLWSLVRQRTPHEDWPLSDVVAAYRLGRTHGMVESQHRSSKTVS
jgi:hypothetical protein